ncbi:MAG: hypothetical protein Q7U10_08085 [Thermodesulfovibrionia bacterium]|nr:hypothetical protein [Thermodesulfovibrionia bacterium]
MSKREIETKKLNTKALWGIGAGLAALGAASWLLVRHKGKQKEQGRATELDVRSDLRSRILREWIVSLEARLLRSEAANERDILAELIRQARAKLAQLDYERQLPLSLRLTLEKIHEAEAEMEEAMIQHEGG